MRAAVGDRIVVKDRHVGAQGQSGVVLAVRGRGGDAPNLVGWEDGQEGLFSPGPDAAVEHDPMVGHD